MKKVIIYILFLSIFFTHHLIAKEEKFFGEEISKFFFENNEIFVHYLFDKDNIDWFNLPKEWHTYLMKKDKITNDIKSAKMIHLINKKFEELWTILK